MNKKMEAVHAMQEVINNVTKFFDDFCSKHEDLYSEPYIISSEMLVCVGRFLELQRKPESDLTRNEFVERIYLMFYMELIKYLSELNNKRKALLTSARNDAELMERLHKQIEEAEKAKEPEEKVEQTNSILDILNELGKDLDSLFRDDKDKKEE